MDFIDYKAINFGTLVKVVQHAEKSRRIDEFFWREVHNFVINLPDFLVQGPDSLLLFLGGSN